MASLIVNVAAFSMTFYLVFKTFKNYQFGVPMSQQRKLRLITLTLLFTMQVSHLIYRGRVLVAPGLFSRLNCNAMFHFLNSFGLVFLWTLPLKYCS